jgi:hypothetical protein
MGFSSLLKHPSAFLPVAMSVAALATVAIALASFGFEGIRQPDEGTAAHIWQLLMAGQLPIVAFFALAAAVPTVLPVLVLQAVAGPPRWHRSARPVSRVKRFR